MHRQLNQGTNADQPLNVLRDQATAQNHGQNTECKVGCDLSQHAGRAFGIALASFVFTYKDIFVAFDGSGKGPPFATLAEIVAVATEMTKLRIQFSGQDFKATVHCNLNLAPPTYRQNLASGSPIER